MPPKNLHLKLALGVAGIAAGLAVLCLFGYLVLLSFTATTVLFPTLHRWEFASGATAMILLAASAWLLKGRKIFRASNSQNLLLALGMIWSGLIAGGLFIYLWLAPSFGNGSHSSLSHLSIGQRVFALTAFSILALGLWLLRRIVPAHIIYLRSPENADLR